MSNVTPIPITTTLSSANFLIQVVCCGSFFFSSLHDAVFHVTDQTGKKLTDENLMLRIQQVFLFFSNNFIVINVW